MATLYGNHAESLGIWARCHGCFGGRGRSDAVNCPWPHKDVFLLVLRLTKAPNLRDTAAASVISNFMVYSYVRNMRPEAAEGSTVHPWQPEAERHPPGRPALASRIPGHRDELRVSRQQYSSRGLP